MAFKNHFWSIGFQIDSGEEYKNLALLALNNADAAIPHANLQYECWHLGNIELWLQTTPGSEKATNRIIDLSLHYNGSTHTKVLVKDRIRCASHGDLDYSYVATMGEDGYPFVVVMPYVDTEPAVPCEATLQITAFAHRLDVFKDEQSYNEREGGPGWASKSFVPCGMFSPNGEKADPPKSMAIFSGIVQQATQQNNSYTGKPFQSATVSSYLADFDVVVGPDVYENPLAEGNVIAGTFWMSAKFV